MERKYSTTAFETLAKLAIVQEKKLMTAQQSFVIIVQLNNELKKLLSIENPEETDTKNIQMIEDYLSENNMTRI